MRANILIGMALTLLFVVISCSNPSNDIETIAVDYDKDVSSMRGKKKIRKQNINIMFAKRWESDNIFLDLEIDGSFEGSIDGEDVIFGKWGLSEDEKTLRLMSEELEGKGVSFNLKFSIMEVTPKKLTLKNSNDKQIILVCS